MATTLTISYTTKSGHVKHVTVGRDRIVQTLKRITSRGGTINSIVA